MPRLTGSQSLVRRLTNTAEQALSLNPFFSDDGHTVVFETTADIASTGGGASFRMVRADASSTPVHFDEIARTRGQPSVSSDGRTMVFASCEDLLGSNQDRNSEIYLDDGQHLRQLTQTLPENESTRLDDGNFQPTLSGDGRFIVFSSNRPLVDASSSGRRAIYVYDAVSNALAKLSPGQQGFDYSSPKISADGSRLFYVGSHAEHVGDLVLHERLTGATRILLKDVSGLEFSVGRSASSNGSRVAYSAVVGEDDRELFLFDVDSPTPRQLTHLGPRSSDVSLSPTISGDGKRIAFATRRKVLKTSDGGVELYLFDVPTGQTIQVTSAPSIATAEVVSSLNFDGSAVVFNFPRIISGQVSDNDLANNSEIYLTELQPRPSAGVVTVSNAADKSNNAVAQNSIVSITGSALAFISVQPKTPSTIVGGTTVKVGGRLAQIL